MTDLSNTSVEEAQISITSEEDGELKEAQEVQEKPEDLVVIESRFGPVEVETSKAFTFQNGLPGLPNAHHFCLTDFPSEKFPQFKLMQSLDSHELSFVVLPLALDNELIQQKDLLEGSQAAEIKEEFLVVMLIASVQRLPSGAKVSVNTKAPILIDLESMTAIQYIIPHSRYDVRHVIE